MQTYQCRVIELNDKGELIVAPVQRIQGELLQKQVQTVELRFDDGRTISNDQRRKIFAIIRDIAMWSGHDPEEIRRLLTWDFQATDGRKDFSLSDCDMSTAKLFISYLIDFCFRWEVPTKDTLLNQCDDIGRYLYLCLLYRKCAICNAHAQVHHVDHVGLARNRDKINHIGMKAVALCHTHHREAHQREKELFEENYIFGIRLDAYLCEQLNLNKNTDKGGTHAQHT